MPPTALVVELNHVYVLGVIRSNHHLVGLRKRHLVGLAYRRRRQPGSQMAPCLEHLDKPILRFRPIIHHRMLIPCQLLQHAGKQLRPSGAQLLLAESVALAVVAAIPAIGKQVREIGVLIGLEVATRLLQHVNEAPKRFVVALGVVQQVVEHGHSLGHVLAQTAQPDLHVVGPDTNGIVARQAVEILLDLL